jgi:hypothetical protein
LSSQKTPAHHHTPRGEHPGLSTTVHPPRSIGSQGVPVRGAASGPVDRASRARSVRRLADNQKVTPRYPTPSNRPPSHAPSTITAGQRPTPAAEPRLTADFVPYDRGHFTPPAVANPTARKDTHRRPPATLGCRAPCEAAHERDIDQATTSGVRASVPVAPRARRVPARSPGEARPP